MYLTSSVLLVVMRYAFASEEQNCTELCDVCLSNGRCLRCISGYYGTNCTKECGAHCRDGACWSTIFCSYGCEDGWHGINCDESCDPKCPNGKCDRFSGYCGVYVPSRPDPKPDPCGKGCSDDSSKDKTMTIEVVLVIVGAIVAFFVACTCCLVKRKAICSDSTSKNCHELEIVPHSQQIVRGHGPTSFTSANVVHSFEVPRVETDSEVGNFPHPSGAPAPSARASEDAPPSYEHVADAASSHEVRQPPPSYEHACRTAPTSVPIQPQGQSEAN